MKQFNSICKKYFGRKGDKFVCLAFYMSLETFIGKTSKPLTYVYIHRKRLTMQVFPCVFVSSFSDYKASKVPSK